MDLALTLAHERRARLAAERLLAQKQAELSVANRELSRHARALSVEIIEKREEVAEVRSENTRVRSDLEVAETKVTIAERRLWGSLKTIQDGFAVFNSADLLVAANPAWLVPFDGLTAVAPGASYAQILQIALEEGMIDIGLESPAVWQERMLERWASDRIEPVTIRLWNGTWVKLIDRRGEGGDMVSLALNITQTMRHEARLREARGKAEAANRAKSAFLANMSHELRTPMNGVVAMADLLAETPLDEEQKSFVDTIRRSGESLLVIINDVLDLSKIDADKVKLHAEPFDLEHLLHEVVALMRPLVQDKALRLIVDCGVDLPAKLIGDGGRMRQVLTNLIGNAVKFTEKGHVLVRARAEAAGVLVTVEDSGIGIDPSMLRHIFGEFNQVEDQRNRKFEGTGLGLAITERLVHMMGGEIWVESQPGQGSTFGFRVPLASAAADDVPVPAPRRVALVDADPVARDVLRGQLLEMGMTVDTFADGVAALAGLGDDTAAIFAALRLPDMQAADLGRTLAEDGMTVPVFALTDEPEHAAGPGLAGVLMRPLKRRVLCETLNRVEPPRLPARRMRVLAAEDNQTNQLVLSKMLKNLDIELRFAGNGTQAVAAQAEWAPDLIFMDISMPEMDGKEATRRIRTSEAGSGRHVPIVALTAHALDGDERDILSAGLDFYLTKPLRKPAILERLRAALPAECRPLEAEPDPPPPRTRVPPCRRRRRRRQRNSPPGGRAARQRAAPGVVPCAGSDRQDLRNSAGQPPPKRGSTAPAAGLAVAQDFQKPRPEPLQPPLVQEAAQPGLVARRGFGQPGDQRAGAARAACRCRRAPRTSSACAAISRS